MKAILLILLLGVSMQNGYAEKLEVAIVSNGDDFVLEGDSYSSPTAFTASKLKRGYLVETDIAIGTILKSHHFSKYDYHEYNETHDGVYFRVNDWSMGTYKNSAYVQSSFFTYNPNLYRGGLFKVNLVAGIADGYDGWEYAQGDYLPVLGVSAQWTYLKTMLGPDAISFGFELPLNQRMQKSLDYFSRLISQQDGCVITCDPKQQSQCKVIFSPFDTAGPQFLISSVGLGLMIGTNWINRDSDPFYSRMIYLVWDLK